jgi:membrane-associated phospholipid phosphatase
LATWLFPVTRTWWDRLDFAVFRAMNRSLEIGFEWQLFWAITNIRAMDALPAILILTIFVDSIWGLRREAQNRSWALFGTLVLIVATAPFAMDAIVNSWLHYNRPSPTLVYDSAHRLSELVPWINTKDASPFSFSGNHAFILATITTYFWYVCRRNEAWLATAVAVVFVMPRLVSGAHWITDIVIGGVVPAFVITSIVYATPLYRLVAVLFYPIVQFFSGLVPSWLQIPDQSQRLRADDEILQ